MLQHRRRPHERRDGFAVGTHSQQFYMSNFFANYEATSEALRATLKIWPCDLVQLSLALALAWPSLHDVVDAGAIEAASSNLLQENVIIKKQLAQISALLSEKDEEIAHLPRHNQELFHQLAGGYIGNMAGGYIGMPPML